MFPRIRTSAAALAAGALTIGTLAAGPGAVAAPDNPHRGGFGIGAPGAGDPYFPLIGNGGIDVVHYDLDLRFTPPAPGTPVADASGQMDATATLLIRPTQKLSRFNLDLRGLQATAVTVNGHRADFAQTDHELVITPRPKLHAGRLVRVQISYGGTTTRPTDAEGSLYGFVTMPDGAAVVSEPDGASSWYPVNDVPTDKASYSFTLTVPEGKTALANGVPTGEPRTRNGWTTSTWSAPDPMASYLAAVQIGDYEVTSYTTNDGLPIIDGVDRDVTAANRATTKASLAKVPAMIEFFEGHFGAYPFVAYGNVVDDDSVGYALENQTRSYFSGRASVGTVAHELVHQWMGDNVSPSRWKDIWLNESWAVYGTWLWMEHEGRGTLDGYFAEVMDIPADDSFWNLSIADPSEFHLFHDAVYDRGGATLAALRTKIGADAFQELTLEWQDRYGGSSATSEQFEALAEEISGQELDAFFTAWLRTPEKPTTW